LKTFIIKFVSRVSILTGSIVTMKFVPIFVCLFVFTVHMNSVESRPTLGDLISGLTDALGSLGQQVQCVVSGLQGANQENSCNQNTQNEKSSGTNNDNNNNGKDTHFHLKL
jgi:hypothetical protein